MNEKKVKLCAFGARYTHSNLALHCLDHAVPFNVQIVEAGINERVENVIERIANGNPDAVGFSCYIWSISHTLRVASSIKKILPDCFIFLGGPEVSFDNEQLMRKHSFIDMIVRGAGEIPFAHFMRRFSEGKSVLDTPSACIRDGSDIVTTPDAPIFDMNNLPFLYDDMSAYGNKIIYYETSRGCPYRCAYCMSAGVPTSFLDTDRVKRELEFFVKLDVRRVKLVDRTFNFPEERAYEIWRALIDLSEKYPQSKTNFHFEISACLLTERVLSLLKKAKEGLIQLEVGIQTTNREALGAINRNHDTASVMSGARALCDMGNIHVHVDLIAGLPYEDYDSFKQSFNDVYALGADKVQLGFLKVLKGSPMFDMTEQYGIEYTEYPPYEVLSTHVMTYEQLRALHRIAQLVDTMHGSGNFVKTLKQVVATSPFDFFERFAQLANSSGYFDQPQGKNVLFELVLEYSNGDETTKEALVYDWLRLEKPRRWPKGLAAKQPSKEALRAFYNSYSKLEQYAKLTGGEKSSRSFVCTFSLLFPEVTTLLFDYNNQKGVEIIKVTL